MRVKLAAFDEVVDALPGAAAQELCRPVDVEEAVIAHLVKPCGNTCHQYLDE
jgi:hypothetical protein